MKRRGMNKQLIIMGLGLLGLLFVTPTAQAQLVNRKTANINGEISMIGNGLITTRGSTGKNGYGNNSASMQYINEDSGNLPFRIPQNSSSAKLALPADAEVIWARLYWSGRFATDDEREEIWIKPPSGSYQRVTADRIHTFTNYNPNPYTASTDVTALMNNGGNGDYFVAGLSSISFSSTNDGLGMFGGWAVIVMYKSESSPYQRLMVFDGDAGYVENGVNQSVSVTNVLTPPTGEFKAWAGALVWEGDAGIAGDEFKVSGSGVKNEGSLSDGITTGGDVWNSRIVHLDDDYEPFLFTDCNPNYENNFGLDLKEFNLSHTATNSGPQLKNSPNPPNGIDIDLEFTSTGDAYYPQALIFVANLFKPIVLPTLNKDVKNMTRPGAEDVRPGEVLEYTISFHNKGKDGSIRTRIEDPLPAEVTYQPNSFYVEHDDGKGITNPVHLTDASGDDAGEFIDGTIVYRAGYLNYDGDPTNGGLLGPDEKVVIRFRVTLDEDFDGTSIDNMVTLKYGAQTFPNDPDKSQEGSTHTNISRANTDLKVEKSVDNDEPSAGTTITYTIKVTNNGPSKASQVVATDLLPSTLTYQSNTTTKGSYDPGTGKWIIGDMADGSDETLTITAKVNENTKIKNVVDVTGKEPDPDLTNNSDQVTIKAVPVIDLGVTKSVDEYEPQVGDQVVFTVKVANDPSADDASGVVLNDLLPDGYSYVSSSATIGSYNKNSGDWFIGILNAGDDQSLTLTAKVNPDGDYENTATVSGNEKETELDDNTASQKTEPSSADVGVIKTVDDDSPSVGQEVTFTIKVTNHGPHKATGVKMLDNLPDGYDSWSVDEVSQGTFNSSTGVWDVNDLDNGADATLKLKAKTKANGSYTNEVEITHLDQDDPNPDNDTDEVTARVSADLSVTKTDEGVHNVSWTGYGGGGNGDFVTFTITVENKGPSDAQNVMLSDKLPTGYAKRSSSWQGGPATAASASTGSYDFNSGDWNIGTLPAGAIATLTLTDVEVKSNGAHQNVATVTADEPDPDPDNNTAKDNPTAQTDLGITKTVDEDKPYKGGNVKFTITVKNYGNEDATGVVVSEELPDGLRLLNSNTTKGEYDGATWSVGSIASQDEATLTITAQVKPDGDYKNEVHVAFSGDDTNLNNNDAEVTLNPKENADLAVLKGVDNPNPRIGEEVAFTITVVNHGPSDATGVEITDDLPDGYENWTLDSKSQGSYDAGTGVWSVGEINKQESVTLKLKATVKQSGEFKNTAKVTATDQEDLHPDNNTGISEVIPVYPQIFGTVYHDTNGLSDGRVDNGLGVNGIADLWIVVVDQTTQKVKAMTPVSKYDGSYSLELVNGIYDLILRHTATPPDLEDSSPAARLPSGWMNTGEYQGTGPGDDGSADGVLTITLDDADITYADFGIQQYPVAGSGEITLMNPDAGQSVSLPANTFSNTTTPEDDGSIKNYIILKTFPDDVQKITIDGIDYTAIPAAGEITIPIDNAGNLTKDVKIEPSFSGNGKITIPYFVEDNVGIESKNPGTALIHLIQDFDEACTVPVTGEDFQWKVNDGNNSGIGGYSNRDTYSKQIIQPGSNGGFTLDIYNLDNSFNMEINGTKLATAEIQFQEPAVTGAPGKNIKFQSDNINDRYEDGLASGIGGVWDMLGDTEHPILRIKISPYGTVTMYGTRNDDTEEWELEPLELVNGNSFNAISWNENSNNVIIVSQYVDFTTAMKATGYGANIVDCEPYTLTKDGVFNDENNDGFAQPGETITYTIKMKNKGDVEVENLKLHDPLFGGEISESPLGDTNNDGILDTDETWEYSIDYIITQQDIDDGGVYNQATVTGNNEMGAPFDAADSIDPTPLEEEDPNYDSSRPDHTFVLLPQENEGLLITNPMIYQKVKKLGN